MIVVIAQIHKGSKLRLFRLGDAKTEFYFNFSVNKRKRQWTWEHSDPWLGEAGTFKFGEIRNLGKCLYGVITVLEVKTFRDLVQYTDLLLDLIIKSD